MDDTKVTTKIKKKPTKPDDQDKLKYLDQNVIIPYQDNHIDMSNEVKSLDTILNKIAFMVDINQDVNKDTANGVMQLAATACEVAETVKYLKSDIVYNNTPSANNNNQSMIPLFIEPMYGDEDY